MDEKLFSKEYYVYVPSWLVGQLKVLQHTLFVTVFTGFIVFFIFRRIIKNNWEQYRCNPNVTKFARFYGHDPKETEEICLSERVKSTSEEVMKPYDDIIAAQQQNSNGFMSSLKGIRGVMDSFKENLLDSVASVFEKFKNIGATIQFLIMKIQAIFQKVLALYITLLYFAWSLLKGLEALVRDPKVLKSQGMIEDAINLVDNPPKFDVGAIGKDISNTANRAGKSISGAFCFQEDTLISYDNEKIPIKDVKINDKLSLNARVVGKLKVEQPRTKVFQLGTAFVTENHLVYNNNTWKEVRSIIDSNTNVKNTDIVYCLVTSNNLIPSSGYIFRDYEEISDNYIQSIISKMILKHLGNSSAVIKPEYEKGERNNCLPPQTLIKMKNDTFRQIKDIEIGDMTSCGRVLGIYECNSDSLEWMEYKNKIFSPNLIIRHAGGYWDKLYNMGTKCQYQSNVAYHVVTENNIIELENSLFIRDFNEINDEKMTSDICNMTIKFMNKI